MAATGRNLAARRASNLYATPATESAAIRTLAVTVNRNRANLLRTAARTGGATAADTARANETPQIGLISPPWRISAPPISAPFTTVSETEATETAKTTYARYEPQSFAKKNMRLETEWERAICIVPDSTSRLNVRTVQKTA